MTPAYTSAPQLNGGGLCPGDVVGAWGGGELEEQVCLWLSSTYIQYMCGTLTCPHIAIKHLFLESSILTVVARTIVEMMSQLTCT